MKRESRRWRAGEAGAPAHAGSTHDGAFRLNSVMKSTQFERFPAEVLASKKIPRPVCLRSFGAREGLTR